MGYHSRIYGEIVIDPPLNPLQVKELELEFKLWGKYPPLVLSVAEDFKEFTTEAGKITVKVPVRTTIASNDMGETRADDVEDICATVTRLFPENSYSGSISIFGDDSTDIWRMVGSGNKIFMEQAVLRWPDGTVVESHY